MFELFRHHRFTDANLAIQGAGSGHAVVLDVRSPGEFGAAHAMGATNLPLEAIAAGQFPQLPPDTTIYVYCRSGSRSAHAQTLLTRAGFTNVHNIGGLSHWRAAGGGIE